MKVNKENNLFGPGGCLTREAIGDFLEGKLDEKDMQKILKHTKRCELCDGALEGAQLLGAGTDFYDSMNRLDNTYWRKSLSMTKSRKIFAGISSVAASILLLLGLYSVFQFKNLIERKHKTVQQEQAYSLESNSDSQIVDVSEVSMPSETIAQFTPNTKVTIASVDIVESQTSIEFELDAVNQENIFIQDHEENLEIPHILFDEDDNLSQEILSVLFAEVEDEDGGVVAQGIGSKRKNEQLKRSRLRDRRSINKRSDNVYVVAEVMPVFQGGGLDDFSEFLVDSLRLIMADSLLNESILVSFRVDTTGKVDKVKIVNGSSSKELNSQIVEMIYESQGWMPAQFNGAPVSAEQELEVVLN